MKCQIRLLGALAAVIYLAQPGAAQELVRTYTPQSFADVGTATNYRYGIAPVFPMGNYAPIGVAPPTCYAPEIAYSAPTTTYYGPAATVVPYSTEYAPTYYGRPYFYAPAPLVPGQPVRNTFRAMTR